MWTFAAWDEPGKWMGLVWIACAFGVPSLLLAAAQIIGSHWRRARETSDLVLLKLRMVERGMSADEIDRVLRAGRPAAAADDAQTRRLLEEHGLEEQDIKAALSNDDDTDKPPPASEAALIERLIENGVEAQTIERVLAALRTHCGGRLTPALCRLVITMAENDLESDDMERVLRAYGAGDAPSNAAPPIRPASSEPKTAPPVPNRV